MVKITKFEKENPQFNHKMIVLARETRRITQEELAGMIDIHKGNLSKVENGIQIPMKDLVEKISKALEYPLDFFKQQDKVLDLSTYYYRKRLQMPKKDLLKSEAEINVTKINIEKLLLSVELPEPNYPRFHLEKGGPAEAARYTRQFWNIKSGKIENLTKLLEDNGIIVIQMDFDGVEIDGLSIVTEKNTPVIFVNKNIPSDRSRLTVAHELGHLVMHIGQDIDEQRDVEKEAFLFGAELLMPENEIKEHLIELNLEKLAELKKEWKVSMGALIMRAKNLETLTENQYQYLWKQMAKLGYKKREPEELDFPKEVPTLLKEVIDAHIEELLYSEKELADFLCLRHEEFVLKYLSSRGRLRIIRGGSKEI